MSYEEYQNGCTSFQQGFSGTRLNAEIQGKCISIMSYYDAASALKLFRRYLYGDCTNGLFYRGAYHLFLNLEKTGQKTVRLILPFRDDPVYNKSNVYQVSRMKRYFYDKARFIAEKFDERDGNEKFSYYLNKKYKFEIPQDMEKL